MNPRILTDCGQEICVTGALSIGRQPENALRIDEAKVSRRHALIHPQNGNEFWIVDLGSSNGTYLNGKRIIMPTRLEPGDRIGIGSTVLTFVCEHHASTGSAPEFDPSGFDKTICDVVNRPCWLLLLDIVGFTTLSQTVNQDELSSWVGQWMKTCGHVIESHGGTVNKFLGDGMLAYWLDDGGISPEAIQALIAQFKSYQQSSHLPFRVVFHHGAVIFGGRLSTGEESLLGPELNLIFRVEKVASELKRTMVATGAFLEKAAIVADFEDLGEHTLKGFAAPVRVFGL